MRNGKKTRNKIKYIPQDCIASYSYIRNGVQNGMIFANEDIIM